MWLALLQIKPVISDFVSRKFPDKYFNINFSKHLRAQHDGPPDPSIFVKSGPVVQRSCHSHCSPKSSGRIDQAANGPDHITTGTADIFYNHPSNRNLGLRILNPPVNVEQLMKYALWENKRVLKRRNRMRRENDNRKLRHRHYGRTESEHMGELDNEPEVGLKSNKKNDKYWDESSHDGLAEYEIHNHKNALDASSSEDNVHMAYDKNDLHSMSRDHHRNTRRVIAYGRDDERDRGIRRKNWDDITVGEEYWPETKDRYYEEENIIIKPE
ncbi:hypothetical protein PAEPH01_2392 [Pancytospora epiphaga]|nr:hypothetical protein PAEPH01_2392 [Pancytospora epiphaga]